MLKFHHWTPYPRTDDLYKRGKEEKHEENWKIQHRDAAKIMAKTYVGAVASRQSRVRRTSFAFLTPPVPQLATSHGVRYGASILPTAYPPSDCAEPRDEDPQSTARDDPSLIPPITAVLISSDEGWLESFAAHSEAAVPPSWSDIF